MTALAALCFSLTAQAQGPLVVSDKDDYGPGETALFRATGFQPGELLDFSVGVSDGNGGWVPDVAWADIPADASGSADVEYVVPETWLDKTLQLTVMGLESSLVATTTFTDAADNINFATSGLGVATSIHITGSGTNNGGHAQTIDQTFNSPGPSADTGLKDGTTYTYSGFPATVPGVGGHYELQSTLPASGSTITSTPTTVIGTYSFVSDTPTNNPPDIDCSGLDAELGQVVGCLVQGRASGKPSTLPMTTTVRETP